MVLFHHRLVNLKIKFIHEYIDLLSFYIITSVYSGKCQIYMYIYI